VTDRESGALCSHSHGIAVFSGGATTVRHTNLIPSWELET
jgi:hypothetical protein